MTTSQLLFLHVLRPVPDPEALRLWQHELGRRLGLHGRVVVAPQGVCATLVGESRRLDSYVSLSRQHPAFDAARFRRWDGAPHDLPGLRVTAQDEVVDFGAGEEVQVDAAGLVDGGPRLTPDELHQLVATRGDEVVLFDGRDRYESQVGRFRGAVVPDANTARDFLRELDSGKFDDLKHRPVVTYCAAGLRSEILTALMTHRGFSEVYHLEGGVFSYGNAFADDGLWEGALYLLGDRVQVLFSDHAAVLGRCESCGGPTSTYRECVAALCTDHALLCNGCADFALCLPHRN